MRFRYLVSALLWFVCCISPSVWSQTRDELVRQDRDNLAEDASWIYDDLDAALADADRSGKPLMVVLRCIP